MKRSRVPGRAVCHAGVRARLVSCGDSPEARAGPCEKDRQVRSSAAHCGPLA